MAYFVGAVVSQLILAALLHLVLRKWDGGAPKLVFIHFAAAAIGIVISAIGSADGGPLNFWDWPYRVAASGLLLGLDILRTNRRAPA